LDIHQVSDQQAFADLCASHAGELSAIAEQEQALLRAFRQKGPLYTTGRCWPLQQAGRFLLDDQYSTTGTINWRERLVCQRTRFNNRLRGAIHVFEQWAQPASTDAVYITEQNTRLYRWLKKKYPQLTGSEYLTASHWLYRLKFALRVFPQRMMHQDLTGLTFQDDVFNAVLTYDCLEHIPDYRQALAELYRVLKPGGQLFCSVPFDHGSQATLTRAEVNPDQSITHHLPPEYHGNPVSRKGSLCFYHFGWDLLEQMRMAGFTEVAVLAYWSIEYAYLGGPQLIFWARK
jgi:SAM-dependent methyltransferase